MQGLKWIFLTLIMGVTISPISLYAADNTADLKRDMALLKNQLQDLEKRIAAADQYQVATNSDTNGNENVNVITTKKKLITNKYPAQFKVKKQNQNQIRHLQPRNTEILRL